MASVFDWSMLPTLQREVCLYSPHAPSCTIPLLLERVPAGFPSPAADHVEAGLDFNDYLVQHKAATFVFTVSGDSMTGAGIFSGDKVVVDRSVEATHGSIVIAVIDGEHTIKRFWHRDGVIELRPENRLYPTIVLQEGDTLEIFGVVIAVVRRLRGQS